MGDEIQVISDGNGIALIGPQNAVDALLASSGLPSRDLQLPRLSRALRAGAGTAQAAAEVASASGRWVQLTEESAKALKHADMMKGSADGLSRAVAMQKGKTKHILEFVNQPGAKSVLTNPAVLSGAAGIMAQLAMQQAMDEITNYLAAIDQKVDDILRNQKDAVLADMVGVGLVVDEAMTIRHHTERVSEVTWSKVQATTFTIARTQAYSLSQLNAVAEKLEKQSKVGEIAELLEGADASVQEWLAVLARCFQLHEAIAVLEMDRVLEASPDGWESHRLGLQAARDKRLEAIATTTQRLLARMQDAAGIANSKVLMHPMASGAVVRSSSQVIGTVTNFHEVLGVEHEAVAIEARRWGSAAAEAKYKALAAGADGVAVVGRQSSEALGRAKSVSERARSASERGLGGLAARRPKWRRSDEGVE